MFYYIGVSLMVWLAAGFITGVKIVWVDQKLTKEKVDELYEGSDEYGRYLTDKFARNKGSFLALCTLMGFVTLSAHIGGIISGIKKKRGMSTKQYRYYTIRVAMTDPNDGTFSVKYLDSVEQSNTAAIRDALDGLTNIERDHVVEVSLVR